MTIMFYNHKALADFEQAHRKAHWRDWFSRLFGKRNNLLSLDDLPQQQLQNEVRHVGLQVVPLDKIVGSEGRYHEFDRAFFPRQHHTKERWVSIDIAHYQDVILPPVELLKAGEMYFVRDGNHRISVARMQRQAFIDANVTEIKAVSH